MKILFIANGSIGDVIISTGILSQLMDEYPEALFTIATSPLTKPLFERAPQVERVIAMEKLSWNRHWILLWAETQKTLWDLIVDLRGSVIAYILNAHHRRVFQKPDKLKSRARQLADLLDLEALPPPRLWPNEDARLAARELLPQDKKRIVIAPKTNAPAKDWPIERFVELSQKLAREDVLFVILATLSQQKAIQPLARALPSSQLIDLSGRTDLPTAQAIIEQAQLFIGNDSGLLHMAAAAGIPCVGIYGPSNDKNYGPTGGHVRLVTAMDFKPGEAEKRDNRYMQMISVDKVEAAARELGVL